MRSPLARSLFLLIALGVAARLALIATAEPPGPSEYDELARSLLAGHGYVYEHLGFNALAICGAIWLLLRLREETRVSVATLSGVVLGLAVLQRGSMALFFACALVWMARFVWRRARGRSLVAAYVIGVMLVVLPWVARNYGIHGILMLESTTPQQFWKGNAVAYYAAVALAAIAGLITVLRRPDLRPDLALILILFASVATTHSLFFVEMRHRWAIEPIVLIFAAAGLAALPAAQPFRPVRRPQG